MNIPFKPITINDKEVITSYTYPSNYQNCDFSFANICSWQFLYETEYAIVNGNLLIRFHIENKTRVVYMAPIGKGNFEESLKLLEKDSLQHGHPLCMLGVTPDARELLEHALPGSFYYIPERDYCDYIYLREDLATLRGKKFQAKRNHINQFTKKYVYEFRIMTSGMIDECLILERKWHALHAKEEDQEDLENERISMLYALQHFEELGIQGGAIYIENQMIAFSFGAPINHNTFGVHVEKAAVNSEGVYAVINKEFAASLPEKYIFLNREEDLGILGLRQAKLSYNPVLLLEKFAAVKKTK